MEYIIYCRKSSVDEEKQAQSIPDQIKRCMDFVDASNGEIVIANRPKDFDIFQTKKDKLDIQNADPYDKHIYDSVKNLFVVTETKTAKTPYVRTKRRKIMKMVDKGEIKWILSYSPDRQARNILEWGELINFVDEEKVSLKYTNFHFEDTASGKMMLGVWFVFAKQYSDAIAENVGRGNKETVWRGKNLWHKKRWYERIPDGEQWEGYYRPNKNRSTVQQAFHMKLYEYKSDEDIAKRMNQQGFEYKYKNRTIKASKQGVSKLWKKPIYYWLLCLWENQSNQNEANPYFKPMISEDEFYILEDRLRKNKWGQSYQKSKEENNPLEILPKSFIHSKKKQLLSFWLPSKKRYRDKLTVLQETEPTATLQDIVTLKNIIYNVGNKKSPDYKLSVKWEDIAIAILEKLDCLKISKKHYEEYLKVMKERLTQERKEHGEILRQHTRSINHWKDQLTEFITTKWHLKQGDEAERKVYFDHKNELEGRVKAIEEERETLNNKDKNSIIEFEVFMDIMNSAGDYYAKASFVQKRKITEIFFSNIIVNNKKSLTVVVKPIFEPLFKRKNSSGAGDETRTRNQQLGRLWL